ncbi:hypothetical protein P3S68_023951 [Capsicum galapagoense]
MTHYLVYFSPNNLCGVDNLPPSKYNLTRFFDVLIHRFESICGRLVEILLFGRILSSLNPRGFGVWCLDIDVRGQDFNWIPFSAGRRICPGHPLALRMIPVILGSLLNSFNWKLEADIEPNDLDMEEKFGLTLAKAHPLRAIPSPL